MAKNLIWGYLKALSMPVFGLSILGYCRNMAVQHGQLTKTQWFLVSGDYILIIHNYEYYIQFLPIEPPKSYTLVL